MTQLTKIDSNVTGLRIAAEESYKVLPGSPVWNPFEPNSYSDFGGQLTTVARNPINAGRQRKKGVATDLDASGGFNNDLTQTNMQSLLQGYFFAALREKDQFGNGAGVITAVATADDSYAGTDIEDDFQVGDLIWASGFTNTGNNGLKTAANVGGPNKITVDENLTDEGGPPAAANIQRVGFESAADDLGVTAGAAFPVVTSSALDFTTLGLIPGEWIFMGGDLTANKFVTAGNNGFMRVRSIATNALTIDKAVGTMATEVLAGGEEVHIFIAARILKNESDPTLIARTTYQLERTLGAPDDASPAEIQAEYVEGAVPNEFTFNIPPASKLECDLTFVGADSTTIDGPTSLKSGTRPTLVESDAFNTSSDFSRIKMSLVSTTDEAVAALFAFVTDLTITINNGVTPNKAVGTFGAFEATAGTFEVGGELTAYFANVSAVESVRANADITLDVLMAKSNSGISIDIPLITLGDGRPDVEQDEPITLPLNMAAATGAKVASTLDHTLMMGFFDYLPTAAE